MRPERNSTRGCSTMKSRDNVNENQHSLRTHEQVTVKTVGGGQKKKRRVG